MGLPINPAICSQQCWDACMTGIGETMEQRRINAGIKWHTRIQTFRVESKNGISIVQILRIPDTISVVEEGWDEQIPPKDNSLYLLKDSDGILYIGRYNKQRYDDYQNEIGPGWVSDDGCNLRDIISYRSLPY
jgi:hypothetical protein